MQSVEQARDEILAHAHPTGAEMCPLGVGLLGRILAKDIIAQRTQPPSAASAMDGYAIQKTDLVAGKYLTVIGDSAAGHPFSGTINAGQAVRIFTGAVIPDGADHVVIQEQTTAENTQENTRIILGKQLEKNHYIRPAGLDFSKHNILLNAPKLLTANDIALIAAAGVPFIPVRRKPHIAIIANGDELAWPGCTDDPQAILTSNNFGIAALATQIGGKAELTQIAPDRLESVVQILNTVRHADIIVTIGGASVGQHDLIHKALLQIGATLNVQKIAMRPGKPLMAGTLGQSLILGLPGNPVSAMICAHIFLQPAIKKMLGMPENESFLQAVLTKALPENGGRAHYMRAILDDSGVHAFEDQDSSRLALLSRANALILRPPYAPSVKVGTLVSVLPLY